MKYWLALSLMVLLTACSAFSVGDSRKSISSKLDSALMEYEYNGRQVVWTYEWRQHSVGATGKRTHRTVVYLKDGKVDEMTKLGCDRAKWVEVLKSHGKDFGDKVNKSVLKNEVAAGMPLDALMISWGTPRGDPLQNPKVGMKRKDVPQTGKLYYLRKSLYAAYWVHLRDGIVIGMERAPRSKWNEFYW